MKDVIVAIRPWFMRATRVSGRRRVTNRSDDIQVVDRSGKRRVPGADAVRLYASTTDGGIIADDVVATLSPALEPIDSKNPNSHPWASAGAIAAAVQSAVASV